MVVSHFHQFNIKSQTCCRLRLQIRFKTNEPVWEEAFTFPIHNPKTQELEVEVGHLHHHESAAGFVLVCVGALSCAVFSTRPQVKDAKHECSLGTLALPLSRLLEAEDMTLNQHFPLKNSGPSCTIKMKMALRVGRPLTRHFVVTWMCRRGLRGLSLRPPLVRSRFTGVKAPSDQRPEVWSDLKMKHHKRVM